jgi:hypothetical protein
MLGQVPGFTIITNDQGRGLGQASDNVIINGERVRDEVRKPVRRAPAHPGRAGRADREIVDGATLGIPGLSGQIANVITKGWRGQRALRMARALAAAVRQDELRRRRGLGRRLDSAARLEPSRRRSTWGAEAPAATAARPSMTARGM